MIKITYIEAKNIDETRVFVNGEELPREVVAEIIRLGMLKMAFPKRQQKKSGSNITECKLNRVRNWIGRRIVTVSYWLGDSNLGYSVYRFGLGLSFSCTPINGD